MEIFSTANLSDWIESSEGHNELGECGDVNVFKDGSSEMSTIQSRISEPNYR